MKVPFFSVIVPVYNVAPYLRRCLDSLAAQTLREMEVILVDDGSTDGSGEICDEYAAKYDDFRVIHQENRGLSGARNSGMEAAAGEWLSFVDSDDWVDPDMLERLQGYIYTSGADVCRFNPRRVGETGEYRGDWIFSGRRYVTDLSDEKDRFRFYTECYLKFRTAFAVWLGVYRHSIVREHHIRFVDTDIIYAEDLLFNFQYFLHVRKFVQLSDMLYSYRMRRGSLVGMTRPEMQIKRVGALAEYAFKSVCEAELPYFRENFCMIYFYIMNFHVRPAAGYMSNSEIRRVIDELRGSEFHNDCMEEISRNEEIFRRDTTVKWYAKDFR